MEEARLLITVFRELNETSDRKVALFTSSLISLFGSTSMFNAFLDELETTIANGKVPEAIKTRALNLAKTYIPQVAGLNDIQDLDQVAVTPEKLRGIRNDSAENRKDGARIILAALNKILGTVKTIG